MAISTAWQPQRGPQLLAINTASFVDELLYGGARGGGKTDYLLGDFGQDVGVGWNAGWRGIMFRRSYTELEETIERSKEVYPAWFPGARFEEQRKRWRFPWGEVLYMRYLERPKDADIWKGRSLGWLGYDEIGDWNSLAGYNRMKACVRSAQGVANLRIRASANPGGAGHSVVKTYFKIDQYPNGGHLFTDPDSGMSRMFIKSRVSDNRLLMENDPSYINRLKGAGTAELVRAWLDGDWDAILGAYFDCWRTDKHVLRPFDIPDHWTKFRAFDWGSSAPFSVGWWAIASEDYVVEGQAMESGRLVPRDRTIPKGAMVRYREWYGARFNNDAWAGLKMTVEAVADGIREREADDRPAIMNGQALKSPVHYSVADPSIFAEDGGPSRAERMRRRGVVWQRGKNKRIQKQGAVGGWDQMRARLMGLDPDLDSRTPGTPMIFCFDTCEHSIRTIPSLQHDELRMEDLDTTQEDHAADEWRYACMSRPWTSKKTARSRPITDQPTLDELIELNDAETADDEFGYAKV